jgi:hypothetical protein
MAHYAETGQVLGKGTHDLEGYSLEGKGYFGPGEMPVFESTFFDMPHGDSDEWAFDQLKKRAIAAGGKVTDEMFAEFKKNLAVALTQEKDVMGMAAVEEVDYI